MNYHKLMKYTASIFMIWLMIMIPMEVSEALSYISTPEATNVTHESAVIEWGSDVVASGKVYYGEENMTSEASGVSDVLIHRVLLEGLIPNTGYRFFTNMTNGTDYLESPDDGTYYSFKTDAAPDTTPPKAPVNLRTTQISTNYISVEWDRNPEDDSSDVDGYNTYLDGQFREFVKSRSFVYSSGIEADREYTIEVSALDVEKNEGPKASITASTKTGFEKDIFISSVDVQILGTDVTITWRTNFPTNAEVNYGLTPEILDKTVTTVEYEERHEVNLTDLQEGTTYWFTILACDEHMNCANTTPENFTTAVKVELFLEIDEPKINASATEDYFYHDTYELDIKGRTAPYSDIDVFMNGNHKRFKRMYEQTVFQFSSIDLDPTLEENLFKITADDREGHILSIEKKILVDRFEPDIKNVTIPGFTPESHFTVSGNMSDVTDVDVNMYLLKPSFAFHSVGDPNGEFAEYYNQQGPQTMLAYEVKQAAEQIANASTYKGVVQNIMNWISQNLGSETCNEDARSLERHAKEIIVSKCAVSSEDLTVAFVALSRAKGIPAKYVQAVEESWLACVNDYSIDAENCLPRRTQAFSEVYIDDKKTWYAVDVAAKAFTEKDMGEHFVPKGEYSGSTMLTLGYGRDAWSLNIRDQESMNSALMMGLSQGYSDQLTSIFVDSTKIYSDGTTNARPFNAQLGPLEEGKNAVLIEFVDQAGNARTFEREIIYDTTPPRITTPTDLMIYSPSYVWEIKINGQVDDIAEVYVFVNKDPSDLSNAQRSVMTDNNGTFDIQVDLAVAGYAGSDLKPDWDNTSEPAQEHEVGIGAGVVSHVTLIAVDEAGQMSDPVSGEILFGQCSEGNADWKITVTDASPASLNTRELLEGIASFGFAFNLTWQGGGDAKNAQVADVVVRSAPIGQAYEGKQYDKAEDYITIQRALNNNRTRGVVLANFKPVASEGNTTYELEEHISQRGKDGMCMIPEVGCFKFLLTLEVSYSYSDPSGSGYYGYQGGSQEQTFGQQPQTLQKHCFPIEIMVDERMDPSIIPNDFLNKTVQFLDQVIKFIDMVLGPLTQITKYVLIGCLVMMIAVFATNIAKQFSCKWSSVLATQNFKDAIKDAIGGKGGLRSAAEQGLCEQIYEGDGKEAAKAACETCSQKVKTYQKTRFAHRFMCDRVICPSVPTFQKYIKDNHGGNSGIGKATGARTSTSYGESGLGTFITPSAVKAGEGPTGKDAGFLEDQLDLNHDCELVDSRGAPAVTAMWNSYKANKKSLDAECKNPHPYQPQCCAATYQYDWKWGAIFIDPLEQSVCLANPNHPDCGFGQRLVNGIVGICEPDNKNTKIQTAENLRYTQDFINRMRVEPDGNVVYLIEFDDSGTKLKRVVRGYIKRKYDLKDGEDTIGKNFIKVQGDQGFVPDSKDLADAFDEVNDADPDADKKATDKLKQRFYQDIRQNSVGSSRPIIAVNKYGRTETYPTGNAVAGYAIADITGMATGCQGDEREGMGGIIVESSESIGSCTKVNDLDVTIWRKDGTPVNGVIKVTSCPGANSECAKGHVKDNCYTLSSGIKQSETDCPGEGDTPSGGSDNTDAAVETGVGAAVTQGGPGEEEGKDAKGDKSDDKSANDECAEGADVPAPYQEKNGKCCNAGFVWKTDTCVISTASCNIEQQKEQEDGSTECCPKGNAWDSYSKTCTPYKSADLPASDYAPTDKDIKEAYERIAGEVGTVDQKYVISPAESFVQSMIALCLTGIRSYLMLISRILKQLKMCFEAILITGDGSAGQCEAIISQYICDLIIEAISCIMKKYSAQGPSDSGGGVGNFLGAINDANTEVMGDVTSRYGDKNIFTEQFSTASIAKGICIFAFTGEWPAGFGALLDSATTIPVQSFALVFPADRRFQTYDIEGHALYSYHIGASFFAGAPTRARLELVCSGPEVECPDNGREGNKCDCAERGEQVLSLSLSSSACKPSCKDQYNFDEECTTECFFKPERMQYRYDRARLVWEYTGGQATPGIAGPVIGSSSPNPEKLSGKEEHVINEIGGAPFGLCHFDALEMRYFCGMDPNPGQYARIANVNLAVPAGQSTATEPVFKIGDSHIMNIDIVSKVSDDLLERCSIGDCEATKYLSIVIKNHNGAVVYPPGYAGTSVTSADAPTTLPPAERINGNQVMHLAFSDRIDFATLPPFKITEDMFNSMQTSTTSATTSANDCHFDTNEIDLSCTADSIPADDKGKAKGVTIRRKGEAGSYKLEAERYNIVQEGGSPKKKHTGGAIPCTLKERALECKPFKFTYNGPADLGDIRGGNPPLTSIDFAPRNALPGTSSAGAQAACANPSMTYNWQAVIKLYGAQQDGTSWSMSPQPATSPTGNPTDTERVVPFKVSCGVATGGAEGHTKISQLGSKSATFTPGANSEYGITVDGMQEGESVSIANYRKIDGASFAVDILVEAMIADIKIDLTQEDWKVSNGTAVYKSDVGELPNCVDKGDGQGPQPRPCSMTAIDGSSAMLYLRRGDPTFTFKGLNILDDPVAYEGEPCNPPYAEGKCMQPDVWQCTDTEGKNASFVGSGKCAGGVHCCGHKSLACCESGEVKAKYDSTECSAKHPGGVCIDTKRIECLKTGTNEYGHSTGTGEVEKTVSGLCPGDASIKCCPTGNYKVKGGGSGKKLKPGDKGPGDDEGDGTIPPPLVVRLSDLSGLSDSELTQYIKDNCPTSVSVNSGCSEECPLETCSQICSEGAPSGLSRTYKYRSTKGYYACVEGDAGGLGDYRICEDTIPLTGSSLPCNCYGKVITASSDQTRFCCNVGYTSPFALFSSHGYSDPCRTCEILYKTKDDICERYEESPSPSSEYWEKENCKRDFCKFGGDCYWEGGGFGCEVRTPLAPDEDECTPGYTDTFSTIRCTTPCGCECSPDSGETYMIEDGEFCD